MLGIARRAGIRSRRQGPGLARYRGAMVGGVDAGAFLQVHYLNPTNGCVKFS